MEVFSNQCPWIVKTCYYSRGWITIPGFPFFHILAPFILALFIHPILLQDVRCQNRGMELGIGVFVECVLVF